jgi:hypothetical protein
MVDQGPAASAAPVQQTAATSNSGVGQPIPPDGRTMSFVDVQAFEQEMITLNRTGGIAIEEWWGIGLSGGGIRAATFCLGALQKLASADLLKNFEYVSSVSGGGYLASALQWWWSQDKNFGTGPSNFPFGSELYANAKAEKPALRFLRSHGSYLTPGDGISLLSGLAVVLRTIFLNMIVWLPISVLIAFLLLRLSRCIVPYKQDLPGIAPFSLMHLPIIFEIFIVLAIALIGVVTISAVVLAWSSILVPPDTREDRQQKVTRASKCAIVGLILGGVWYVLSGLDAFSSAALSIKAAATLASVVDLASMRSVVA